MTTAQALSITLSGPSFTSDDLVAFATDCSTATPDVTPVPAMGLYAAGTAFDALATGTYKLCYQAGGAGEVVEQAGVALTVVAATANNVITAAVPGGRVAGVVLTNIPTRVALTGTVTAGDTCVWATDCSAAPTSPSQWLTLKEGTDASTTFTMSTAGVFKLCYRAVGGSDVVEQVLISTPLMSGSPCLLLIPPPHASSSCPPARPSCSFPPCLLTMSVEQDGVTLQVVLAPRVYYAGGDLGANTFTNYASEPTVLSFFDQLVVTQISGGSNAAFVVMLTMGELHDWFWLARAQTLLHRWGCVRLGRQYQRRSCTGNCEQRRGHNTPPLFR